MNINFAKLNGLGNDFVFIDDLTNELSLTDEQVAYLCDRYFGIGADGVIMVRPSAREECAAYMHYINADGTLAQMCGNGVRCFAKYLVDRGLVDASAGELVADTLAGPKPIRFSVDEAGKMTTATVDMGEPILEPSKVPVAVDANAQTPHGVPYVREAALTSPWGDFAFTCVSMGNPHTICFIDSFDALPDALFTHPGDKRLATFDVNTVGAYFESHTAFPEKTNVEFACVEADGIHMRVYERGCAETLACGTGACATNVAACLTGRAGCENDVILRGGTLHITWANNNHVMMTGPAKESFTGTVRL
ncbi:diaminopimelate epimerase [Adlercreutzia sp. ZJ141]|uniref:diaminopimelate epimerase n=1 Tax=Adlercreutzia sp. ZJ141 TaxID=2709406 RepID=UPI0013ED8626|nr:diaminopimelate epimerase [Adlercreutzia sp. ZJ141]